MSPCCRFANAALAVDPENTKALYRRGKASFSKGDLDNAKSDWLKVQVCPPPPFPPVWGLLSWDTRYTLVIALH